MTWVNHVHHRRLMNRLEKCLCSSVGVFFLSVYKVTTSFCSSVYKPSVWLEYIDGFSYLFAFFLVDFFLLRLNALLFLSQMCLHSSPCDNTWKDDVRIKGSRKKCVKPKGYEEKNQLNNNRWTNHGITYGFRSMVATLLWLWSFFLVRFEFSLSGAYIWRNETSHLLQNEPPAMLQLKYFSW